MKNRTIQEGCSVHGEFDYCVRTHSPMQIKARRMLSHVLPAPWLQSTHPIGGMLAGRITHQVKHKKNLVLTQGRDELENRAFAEMFTHCAIGSGTAAPTTSQTGLETELFRTANNTGTALNTVLVPAVGETPHEFVLRRFFEFPVGTFNGEAIEETGFSWSATAAANLFSRALFPSTLNLADDQSLEITYRLHVTFTPDIETVGSFTLTNHPQSPVGYHRMIQDTRHNSNANRAVARIDQDGNVVFSNLGGWNGAEAQLEPANSAARIAVLNLDEFEIQQGTSQFAINYGDVGEKPTLFGGGDAGARGGYDLIARGRSGNVFFREYKLGPDDNNGPIAYITLGLNTTNTSVVNTAWMADLTGTPNSLPNSDSDWLDKDAEFEMTLRFELVVSIN